MISVDATEREFSDAVIDLAHTFGWKVAHFRPAQSGGRWVTPVAADGAGFPDLVLVGPGGVIFAELKSRKGRLDPKQERWRDWVLGAGGQWFVWRPADMPEVIRVLSLGRAGGR